MAIKKAFALRRELVTLDSNEVVKKKFDKHITKRFKELTAQEKEEALKRQKREGSDYAPTPNAP